MLSRECPIVGHLVGMGRVSFVTTNDADDSPACFRGSFLRRSASSASRIDSATGDRTCAR